MGLESTVSNQKSNTFINQDTKCSKLYGNSESIVFNQSLGNYVATVKTYKSSSYNLSGISLEFDNGEVTKIGDITSSETGSLDLKNDSIARIYVQVVHDAKLFGGNNKGIKTLYIETVKGVKFTSSASGHTPANNNSGWQLMSNVDTNTVCQNAVLLGIAGRAGKGIDSLSIWYKDDVLISRSVDRFTYTDLAQAVATPINVATATVHNGTSEEQDMSISFEKSVSSSYTWGVDEGLKLGASATFKTGVPYVAKEELTVSAELSFNTSFGATHTVDDTFSYTATVNVPANSSIIVNAVASSYTIAGTYSAVYVEQWAHAGLSTKNISGTIQGLTAYNVVVDYETSD